MGDYETSKRYRRRGAYEAAAGEGDDPAPRNSI